MAYRFSEHLIKKGFLMFVFFCACLHIQAQNKFTISGTVKDKQTGELLIGASVKLEGTNINAVTNGYGFYSITAAKGNYAISINYAGYKSNTQKIDLQSNTQLMIDLESVSTLLNEVVVSTKRKNENIAKPLMGVEKLSMKDLNNLPVLLGEKDVLKSMQLLPGIKSAGDGNSGFYVRGGSADQLSLIHI